MVRNIEISPLLQAANEQDFIDPDNFFWDVGYGFTFNTALGSARIDFAYPHTDL